jgi:hypothetical protein
MARDICAAHVKHLFAVQRKAVVQRTILAVEMERRVVHLKHQYVVLGTKMTSLRKPHGYVLIVKKHAAIKK